MKRSQASIEMIVSIIIIITIFASILIFSSFKRDELKQTEDFLDRKDNCLKISNLISEVYVSGDGTKVIAKTKYNISIEDNLLVDDNGVSCWYNADVISNQTFNNMIIKNLNGEVLIENV